MNHPNDDQAGSSYRLEAHASGHANVYQVGSGTQHNTVQNIYTNDSGDEPSRLRPFDLPNLRLWIDRIAVDYQQLITSGQVQLREKEMASHLKQLDALRQSVTESPRKATDKDSMRRLLAGGVAQYLSRAGQLPAGPLPEHLILDVMIFALWPVIETPKFPSQWQLDLAELTSPRVASIVATARNMKATGDQVSVEALARALSGKPIDQAVLNFFGDLADPGRGGAALAAIAIASGLPRPPRFGGAKAIGAWVLGLTAAAVGVIAVTDIDTTINDILVAGRTGDHHPIAEHVDNIPHSQGGHHHGYGLMEHLIDDFINIF